jgi:hypothetical protein
MHRLARLPIALLAAAGLGLGALLPERTQSSRALDFWDWDAPAFSSPGDGSHKSGTPNVDMRPAPETPVIDRVPALRPADPDVRHPGPDHP